MRAKNHMSEKVTINERLAVSDQYDLGVYLHTALRKCCDSTVTSLAYNLIAMRSMSGPWEEYLSAAWPLLQGVGTDEEVVRALKRAVGVGLDVWEDDDARERELTRERSALLCCFKLFTTEDFLAMAAWVLKDDNQARMK